MTGTGADDPLGQLSSAPALGKRLVRLFQAGREHAHEGDADLGKLGEQFQEHAPVDPKRGDGGLGGHGGRARLLGQDPHLAHQGVGPEQGEEDRPGRPVDAYFRAALEDHVSRIRDVAAGEEPLTGLEMHPLAREREQLEARGLDLPEQRDLSKRGNLGVEGHGKLYNRVGIRAGYDGWSGPSMRFVRSLSSPLCGLAVLAALALPDPATARLVKAELDRVTVAPEAGARVPLDLPVSDARTGQVMSLGAVLDGRPALLLPVDYTCRNVCDPMVAQSADALAATGLRPLDRRLILMGIDPHDDAATADAQVAALWGDRPDPPTILVGGAREIARLTQALGYRYTYDPGTDSFAHPAAALLLTGDGRLAQVLSPLALSGRDLRLAMTEASQGRIGSFTDRLTLLCYGFDAAKGLYAPLIGRILTVAGLVTVAGIALLVLALIRIRRRHEQAADTAS